MSLSKKHSILSQEIMAKSRLLSAEVADKIKDLIISKKLSVGERLPNEIELSESLGVSRITIREAIKLLSSSGTLEIRRGIGTFVSDTPGLSNDPLGLVFLGKEGLLKKIHQSRMAIEPRTAAWAAQYATEEDIKVMEANLAILNGIHEEFAKGRLTKAMALTKYMDAEITFHLSVYSCLKNDVLDRILYIILEAYMLRYQEIELIPDNEFQKKTHRAILEAIRDHDPAAAEVATIKHLEFGETIIDIIEHSVLLDQLPDSVEISPLKP
jgi:DNA-binding FadR family transcriptional regulator